MPSPCGSTKIEYIHERRALLLLFIIIIRANLVQKIFFNFKGLAQCFMKHLFVSMSVKQNLFVSVFVQKCLMMLNDVEYTTFKMFVTQMNNYLFVINVL